MLAKKKKKKVAPTFWTIKAVLWFLKTKTNQKPFIQWALCYLWLANIELHFHFNYFSYSTIFFFLFRKTDTSVQSFLELVDTNFFTSCSARLSIWSNFRPEIITLISIKKIVKLHVKHLILYSNYPIWRKQSILLS